jgi:hypothetical protein
MEFGVRRLLRVQQRLDNTLTRGESKSSEASVNSHRNEDCGCIYEQSFDTICLPHSMMSVLVRSVGEADA